MTKPDDLVWVDVISFLRTKHPAICRQWFEEIEPVGVRGGVYEASVANSIRREYLKRECVEPFNEAIQAVTGRLLTVRFVSADREIEAKPLPSAAARTNGRSHAHAADAKPSHSRLIIVPDFTFDNFVVGPENRLAVAAATAVAQNPGLSYNPLFVHGGVGLGKTHLLQAVCLELMSKPSDLAIYYVSCDEFMNQFMEAVEAGEMLDFRHRFRDVDVLVIDDIHFLAKRDRTQEEFFHTFNTLYPAKKQIVLSSDAPPQEIPDLEDRLVSRFKSGLVVEVGPPSYDTRVQIVKQKARLRGQDMTDDVACLIASRAPGNIRELEGAITTVHMQCIADQKPLTLELAKSALGSLRDDGVRPQVTITTITDAVTDYYGVKLTDLQSKHRQKSIAHPRQVCMYLARKLTRFSLEEIGGHFGGRDHTTVMHAVRIVGKRREENPDLDRILSILEMRILSVGETRPVRSA